MRYIISFLTGTALSNIFPDVLSNLNIGNIIPTPPAPVPITAPQPNTIIQIVPSGNTNVTVTVIAITIVGAFGTTLYFLYDWTNTPNLVTQIVANATEFNTNQNLIGLGATLQEAAIALHNINEAPLPVLNTANLINNLNVDPILDENMESRLRLLNEVLRRANANNARIGKFIRSPTDVTNMFRGAE